MSSSVRFSPVSFMNLGFEPHDLQNMGVLVRSSVSNGEDVNMCRDMFSIEPFGATLNVTIVDSQFRNHRALCRCKNRVSALIIYGHSSNIEKYLNIFLANLLIENNYYKTTLHLQ